MNDDLGVAIAFFFAAPYVASAACAPFVAVFFMAQQFAMRKGWLKMDPEYARWMKETGRVW